MSIRGAPLGERGIVDGDLPLWQCSRITAEFSPMLSTAHGKHESNRHYRPVAVIHHSGKLPLARARADYRWQRACRVVARRT